MEEIKNVVRDNFYTKPGNEVRVHLFNCDKTYNLDSVEELFCEVRDDIRKKLNFDIKLPIGKNYFSLSKMSEMYETTIPKLQMDFAVFVVHANESRLSINEDNAGIGYAKIYRALLKATSKSSVKAEVRERAIIFPTTAFEYAKRWFHKIFKIKLWVLRGLKSASIFFAANKNGTLILSLSGSRDVRICLHIKI